MEIITKTDDLAGFCAHAADHPWITIDTEFLRESTYWAQLCLVQMATTERAVIVDPLAPGIDLAPLYELMRDKGVLKVFHAARQDVEIFVKLMGQVPFPIFDTQVAAMVCGHGEQIGYENLVRAIVGAAIDKAHRFTDWSRRPLSQAQLEYALCDVTHLRDIYTTLAGQIEAKGRQHWIEAEMKVLTDMSTYVTDPAEAWRRLKPRTNSAKFLGVLKSVADWRERAAQHRDLPRNRVLKDEAITEIAANRPRDAADLGNLRAVPRGVAEGTFGPDILKAIERGLAMPKDQIPELERIGPQGQADQAALELLRVLLKICAAEQDVAPRLVASSADLEMLAAGERDVPAMSGWRREVFGAEAEALLRGERALIYREGRAQVLTLEA